MLIWWLLDLVLGGCVGVGEWVLVNGVVEVWRL